MARGPFQGTFNSSTRPTVVTAPDAIVYINGETEIMGCPSCRRRFDINKYIVSVQADLSIDSTPGSCSISLSIPRHAIDDFYFDGKPILQPMMEVEVFAKGYYLIEGMPQYYPIFWGLVTEVGDSYSSGEHTVSIQCSDILKWWELCKMNINPAFTQATGQQGRSTFGNVFYGRNPYDVIWTLAQQSFGDVIVGTGSLVSMMAEERQQTTFTAAMQDLMRYWQSRFQRIRSNLLLYGTKGVAVRGDSLYETFRSGGGKDNGPFASAAVKFANGGIDGGAMAYDPTDPEVVAFRTQHQQAGSVNFWQSEYQTKLEMANAAKDAIGYEFFMDVTGDIVFKPPFYNLDTLSNKPVSWIQDIDIIDWDFSESEAEVVTQLVLQGSFGGNVDYSMGEEVTPFTSVTDYHLLRQYGWRSQTFNSEFLGSTQLMFYTGMDMLDRLNARRHRGTINIPMRPELRLGFPVYVAPKDQFWYVAGISHNIQFGGRAQTTLTLTARRGKFIAPHGIGKLKLTNYNPPAAKQNVNGPGNAVAAAKDVLGKHLIEKGDTASKRVAKALLEAIKAGSAKGGGKPEPDKGGATGGAQPKVDPNAQATSRQLSQYATFSLKVGDAALMPGTPQPEGKAAPSNNPYAPVILRHPKTGRIMGWPNVVMVYTRPFKGTPKALPPLAGQKPNPSGRGITAAKMKQRDVFFRAQTLNLAKTNMDTKSDDIRKKYKLNRYSYGLNSAGVYIYAHDTSKKIQELLLMPKSRIKNEEAEPAINVVSGDTGMIRPVSDDRGFEVIGHQRYGRGCALRDGSLVISETKDPNNTRANIGTQFALSGSLTDSLVAQSNGLTTVQTPYQNVADATARLTADDQETAAILDQDTPKYVPVEKTFVSTAPLGSPPQQGVPVSLEASQLSRALTLTEMAIRQNYLDQANNTDPNLQCTCLTGRSELAFINVGYKVQTLKKATSDVSSVPTGAAGAGSASGMSNVDKRVTQAQQHYIDALANNRPVAVNMMLNSPQELETLIEGYLFDLYDMLDRDHMEFEKTIRGEYMQQDKRTTLDVRSGTGPTPDDMFEPPYGAPNRAALGDPKALLQQASDSIGQINSIFKKWTKFGESIKATSDKAYYSGQISKLNGEVARLEAEKAKIEAATVYAGVGKATANLLVTDTQKQIEYLQQQIDAKKQEITGYELQLSDAVAKSKV